MGWWRAEEGGVDREEEWEEEREERPGEVRGEAVERADEGVVGGVGTVILGLVWSEVCVVAVEDKLEDEGPGLRVEGEEGLGFAVAGLTVRDVSMAEKCTRQRKLTERFHSIWKQYCMWYHSM